MNPTPTVDNDLQKAIDDITKTTNQDPVFADPVAAPSSVPEGDNGELAESVGPFPAPEPAPAEIPAAPAPAPEMPPAPAEAPAMAPAMPPMSEPVISETVVATEVSTPTGLNMREVKAAALRDLAPLVGKMDLSASQKFGLYRDMFENLRDYTAIEPAYQAAKNIADEHERGEALLYLINSIDKL